MATRKGYTMGNPLWDYSMASYSLEGVAPTCLELQDICGLDVNLLLYAAWLASMDRRISHGHLAEMDARVAEWRARVVMPLRALRQQLRGYFGAQGIRDEIGALELRAEQQQQDMMHTFYRCADELTSADRPLGENLARVAQFASPEEGAWEPLVERLAELLG